MWIGTVKVSQIKNESDQRAILRMRVSALRIRFQFDTPNIAIIRVFDRTFYLFVFHMIC